MTATYSLTEPSETISVLLQELQNDSPAAQQLRESLKLPKTYDDPAIWTAAAVKPAVIEAFDRVRENLPTSDYANRARRRFSINPDSLGAGYTSTIMSSIRGTDDGRKSNSAVLQWNDLGDINSGASEITALDVTRRKLTVTAAGLYSFSTSMCLGFYPIANLDDSFEDQLPITFSSLMKGVGFRVYLEVWQGSTMEYCLTLVDSMMSRGDFLDRRKRFVGGSLNIYLTAGSVVRIIFQRDSRLGNYSKTNSSTGGTVLTPEGIGFTKFIPADTVNQLRDTQNWLEIIRLA